MTKNYKQIAGDVSGSEALWARKESGDTYAVVELNSREDMDASKYNVMAGYVDLRGFSTSTLPGYFSADVRSALKSYGWELDENGDIIDPWTGDTVAQHNTAAYELCLVQCLWSWGCKDRVSDTSGNNRSALLRAAKRAL